MLQDLLSNKRLLAYLLINVVVSALTTLLVIALWMRLTLSSGSPILTATRPSGETGQLRISAVIGGGDLQNERVVIDLVGNEDVSLSGWRLRDQNGNEYRFPALVLHPGAQVSLFTKQGSDTASELFWGRSVAVWSTGELASLLDASGQLQASFTVP